jgi:superfamily II DNA helicase RecQ
MRLGKGVSVRVAMPPLRHGGRHAPQPSHRGANAVAARRHQSAVLLHRRESPDTELLKRLKALRRELASAYGVPPHAVFSNATLYEIVVRHPASEDELLEISGIGRTKLARYARQLLRLLRRGRLES